MKHKKGFTLIEVLLYVGLVSLVVIPMSGLYSLYSSSRVKAQVIAEVEQQGLMAMQIVTQAIRNADSISAPSVGAPGGVLNLVMTDGTKNPTIFDSVSNRLQIKEGVASTIFLTSPRVALTNLEFANLSRIGTPGIVRVKFTLSYVNVSNKSEYNYSKTFYATGALR